jgi:hypothetical protein
MVKAFRVNSSKEDIANKVEKKRDKGGGFLKKKPEEKLGYLRLLLFPGVFFEYQYLKKKGLMGGKVPHRAQTFFIAEPEIVWMPDLGTEMKEKGLVDISEGHYIPLEQGQAEQYTTTHFGLMKSHTILEPNLKVRGGKKGGTSFTTVVGPGGVSYAPTASIRKALNYDAEDLNDLQTPLQVSVVYVPYWVAKLDTPDSTRYLVFNRDGQEDNDMTNAMNTNIDFVLDLERRATEI